MSRKRTCAISSSISFLSSAAIWVHVEMPDAPILLSLLLRVESKGGLKEIAERGLRRNSAGLQLRRKASHLAVFFIKLPSVETEIDCKLQSNCS